MSNNAYYFSHDSNAKDDPKCMLLIDQLGLEGYGIFWVLIEVLRDQPEYSYPLNLVPILARRYNTTAEKMLATIKNYGLFEFDDENNFFSLSLNRRMEKVQIGIEQRRIAGLISAEKRRNKALTTDVERPLNECSTKKRNEMKGKEIKLKENKEKHAALFRGFENIINEDFKEIFIKWLDYKKDKGQSYKNSASAELAYKKLISLSNNDLKTANDIVEQSMANNWAGLFELKVDFKPTKPKSSGSNWD